MPIQPTTHNNTARTPAGHKITVSKTTLRNTAAAICAATLLTAATAGFGTAKAASGKCPAKGIHLQVLGAGGPQLDDDHASTGYLIWRDGKAKALIDIGGGTALNFEKSGAKFNDLEAIAFSHFHIDHAGGLPALVKGGFFTDRKTDLPILGPDGNKVMPSTTAYLKALFGKPDGAYKYMNAFLNKDARSTYKMKPKNIKASGKKMVEAMKTKSLTLKAIPVKHGPLPALAWRVEIGGTSVTFSGDMSGENGTLEKLAKDTTILVAHNAVPDGVKGTPRALHMPPTVIGKIAAAARPKMLVLSHRMKPTFGKEDATRKGIAKSFNGKPLFAEDMQCFKVK